MLPGGNTDEHDVVGEIHGGNTVEERTGFGYCNKEETAASTCNVQTKEFLRNKEKRPCRIDSYVQPSDFYA